MREATCRGCSKPFRAIGTADLCPACFAPDAAAEPVSAKPWRDRYDPAQRLEAPSVNRSHGLDPRVAAGFSFLVSGLGQLVAGRPARGFAWLLAHVAVVFCGLCVFDLPPWVAAGLWLPGWLACVVDAYGCAEASA